MYLQSASQELRNPPKFAWLPLVQEALVLAGVAGLMVLFIG